MRIQETFREALIQYTRVPSINSSALKYLNISDNPGTLIGHEYFASNGRNHPSLTPQDAPATHPRKSCPSATTRGLEPFGKTATIDPY